jgi:hypothetical protein
MNERHEQLMAQAWIEFAPDAKAVTKRFAELIVRECANFVDSYEQIDKYGEAQDIVYGKDLLEHFGFEE